MRKTIQLLAVSLMAAGSGMTNEKGVRVRPGGEEMIITEPQHVRNVVFRVTNTGAQSQEFITEVTLPEGWQTITEEFPFVLGSQEWDIRLLSFFIPQSTPAGVYDIVCRVHGTRYPSLSDHATIRVRVLPVERIEVRILSTPLYAVAGEAYRIPFSVRNDSNVDQSVEIRVKSSLDFPAVPDTSLVFLGPGESAQLHVNVRTPPSVGRPVNHVVQILCYLQHHDDASSAATSLVEIYPSEFQQFDRFHRFPVHASFRHLYQVGETSHSDFQGELSGRGYLDGAENRYLEFLFRGPDTYRNTLFAERDEYRLSFKTRTWSVHAGDRNFSMSPLLENYRYGRGMEAGWQNGRWRIEGYAHRTRWIRPDETQFGAAGSFRLKEGNRIRVHYLNKRRDEESASMYSLGLDMAPWRDLSVALEYALSETGSRYVQAFRSNVRGHFKRLDYHLRFISAAPSFAGYYRDTHLLSTGLSVPLTRDIRWSADFSNENKNFNVDTLRYAAPRIRQYRVGLDCRIGKRGRMNLDWHERSRKDKSPVPMYDYSERFLRARIGRSFPHLSLDASVEVGRKFDYLYRRDDSNIKFTFSGQYKPNDSQIYRAYLYYDDDKQIEPGRVKQFTLGFYADLRIRKHSSISVSYQSNYSFEEYYRDRNLFEARLRCTLRNQHTLSVRGRYTLLRNSLMKSEKAVLAEYRIPIGIPAGRRKNVGFVHGKVYDDATKKPVPGVILRLNGSPVVTDPKGRYSFSVTRFGKYLLMVDRSSLRGNRITVQPTPIEFDVGEGSDLQADLGISRSATLAGNVSVFHDPADTLRGLPDGGRGVANFTPRALSNILLEIENGSEVHRRVTGKRGDFHFHELRPGRWILRIYDFHIPEHHHLEREEIELILQPGEERRIDVPVLPRNRKIKMIEAVPIRQARETRPGVQQMKEVVVREGDSLSGIAYRHYGRHDDYMILYEANSDRISDPDVIYPGQRIRIPDAGYRHSTIREKRTG